MPANADAIPMPPSLSPIHGRMIEARFDAMHGDQQLRLFNAHHNDYGFQPIVVFDGDGRMIAACAKIRCVWRFC